MSSWDRLSSQEYVTGLPLSKLVPELSFPASIEEIQVSALYGLLTCNVELTLLFEPSISDRRAARGVLNSLLEGTNATGSIEERLAPCAMTTELLGLSAEECAAAMGQLQFVPRALQQPSGGINQRGTGRLGPPAYWQPLDASGPGAKSSSQLRASSAWADETGPHIAHGKWSWPASDARCRRLQTFSLFGGTSKTGGALRAHLISASAQWSLGVSTAGGVAPRAPESREVELRVFPSVLLFRETVFAAVSTGAAGSSDGGGGALSWLPAGFAPAPGLTARTHVDHSLFVESRPVGGGAAALGGGLAELAELAVALERQLEGSGFHLAVKSYARFEQQEGRGCTRWAALERLPSGAFFDPHQLRRLARRGGLGGASGGLVVGEVELETPEADSPQAVALVHGPIERSAATARGGGGEWELRSSVPVHLRYGAPATGGHTHRPVELPPPLLFFCCQGGPEQAGERSRRGGGEGGCPSLDLIGHEWRAACTEPERIAYQADALPQQPACGEWRRVAVLGDDKRSVAVTLKARVPVGVLERSDLVLVVTVASIGAATLWLLWVLWRAPTPK